MKGYTNPMRSMERSMAPDFAAREFRNPGLKSTGLGSLRHTMPHLRRSIRMQSGGSFDPVGEAYAAARPNLYNPDPMHRHILTALRQIPMRNAAMTAMPFSATGFSYADGGQAGDLQDVMEPEDQTSPDQGHMRDVVLEALAALEGQSPDPEEALAHFIDTFGPKALADLQQLAEHKHRQEEEGDEGEESDEGEEGTDEGAEGADEGEEGSDEPQVSNEPQADDQLAGAGGGLLHGQGTGQSDEIEGTTPSGRPVLLSDGEYVIDAPTVAALGDGSTSAGARRLDELRKQIRKDAWGHDKQAKPMRKGGAALTLKIK